MRRAEEEGGLLDDGREVFFERVSQFLEVGARLVRNTCHTVKLRLDSVNPRVQGVKALLH